jgi:hypothetical protein
MRQYNPGIVAYKNINTVKAKEQPVQKGSGLLAPTKQFNMQKKDPEPYERVATYVQAIREQREAYDGDNA